VWGLHGLSVLSGRRCCSAAERAKLGGTACSCVPGWVSCACGRHAAGEGRQPRRPRALLPDGVRAARGGARPGQGLVRASKLAPLQHLMRAASAHCRLSRAQSCCMPGRGAQWYAHLSRWRWSASTVPRRAACGRAVRIRVGDLHLGIYCTQDTSACGHAKSGSASWRGTSASLCGRFCVVGIWLLVGGGGGGG